MSKTEQFKKVSNAVDETDVHSKEIGVASGIDVLTDIAQVGPGGQRIYDRAIAHRVSSETAADVRLAAVELATNAFEHGATSSVTMELLIGDASVGLRCDHVDAGIAPDPNDAQMPPPMSARGRGLAIVRSLASTVHRSVIDGVTVTVIIFDRTVAPTR